MKTRGVMILVWLIFLIIIILAIILLTSPLNKVNIIQSCSDSRSRVNRVIDGDTFELCAGEKVRLLCVDTPERGQEGYAEAKAFLEDLILNKEVNLKTSNYNEDDKDKYGRLLLWIFVNDSSGEEVFVNKAILNQGYGELLIIPPETCEEVAD